MTAKTAANHHIFSKNVDKRSRKAMTDFLSGHFRYSTNSSWNHSTSYACNMKIHNLGLDYETVDKLYDMLRVSEFFDGIDGLIRQFGERHQFRWQASWNGRSGGYLVLYQGVMKNSEHRSYCTNCGQKNFRSVAETGPRCGVCSEDTRVDYLVPPKQVIILLPNLKFGSNICHVLRLPPYGGEQNGSDQMVLFPSFKLGNNTSS